MNRPPANFSAVPRLKVYTSIVEQIIENIRAGTFPPGTPLPSERVLAELLGVSRSSLREAVRVLEHAGVLNVRGGSGTYVTEKSLLKTTTIRARAALVGESSPLDLIAARSVIEPACAELAALSRDARDLQQLNESLSAHEKSFHAGEDPSEGDFAFHLAVAVASHNDVYGNIEQYFIDLMHQRTWGDLKGRSRSRDDAGERFLDQHRHILNAIQDGDAKLAKREMGQHMATIRRALLRESEL